MGKIIWIYCFVVNLLIVYENKTARAAEYEDYEKELMEDQKCEREQSLAEYKKFYDKI